MAEEGAWEVTEKSITACGIPLYPDTSFKYLGRILLAADDDWIAVIHNFLRA